MREGSEDRVPPQGNEGNAEGQTASFIAAPNNDLAGSYSVDDFDDKEVANASLTRLTELEAELKSSLVQALGPGSAAFSDRVDAETKIVKRSGIDALSKNSKAVMPDDDHSKNLEEYQKISKKKFEEALNKEALEAEEKKALLEQLDAIHKMRLNLLEKSLREEDQQRMDKAHDRLLGHLAQPSVTRAHINGQRAGSSFLDEISKNNPPEITNPTTGWTIHYDGNVLRSNDPVTLGLAIAAAGYKSATITGAPLQALLTARTALDNGVQKVEFDPATREKILNSNAYRSWEDFVAARTELTAIENIVAANNSARAFKINNAFNEKTPGSLSDITLRFNQIPSSAPGHKQFVERLTPEEQATLAHELKDKSFVIGPEQQLSGDKYIRYLLSDKPKNSVEIENRKAFHKAFAKKVVEEKLPILGKKQDPYEVAKFIGEQKHQILRTAFYNEIQNLTPFEDESRNKSFQNHVKAGLLSQLIDRVTVSKYGPDGKEQLGVLQHLKPEMEMILSNTSTEDRAEIMDIFEKEYDRQSEKFRSLEYEQGFPLDEDDREDILNNKHELPEYLAQPERRDDPEDQILINEKRLKSYEEQTRVLYRRVALLDDAAQRQRMFEGPPVEDEVRFSNEPPDDYERHDPNP